MDEDRLDLELVQRAGAGDAAAFDELMRRHAAMVHRVLRHLGLSAPEAQEVAQAVFIRAWRGLPGFEQRSRVTTWLYRITVNEARRHQRQRAGSASPDAAPAATDGAALPGLGGGIAPAQAAPEARTLTAELSDVVAGALARLPDEWRTAVILRDIEGLSNDEAAAIIGIRGAAFKSRLHRGRLALRPLLEPYLEG